jgi:oxygen-independent coproporphyrinogen III oxidase
MASLYIHIPFCKKACHYCSFYFTLSTVKKAEFIQAICKEIETRSDELKGQTISSIYFGGGTPSLLSYQDLNKVLQTINLNYSIESNAEISIESNPENLSESYLSELLALSFNRLSIGVQSFSNSDLGIMNRNHNASQALEAVKLARNKFENLSIDLIFGLPHSGMNQWKSNLKQAAELDIDHISTYNLTVEEKTTLARKVGRNELPIEADDTLNEMYFHTIDYLEKNGLIQYEISNFGKLNHWSQHNISYWMQKPYLGFGPSAHSYSGQERRWNVSNLKNYIEAINIGENYSENEVLSIENKYNEYVMTRLRTIFGLGIDEIKTTFGENFEHHFLSKVKELQAQNWILEENKNYKLTSSGKVLADHLASELML